MEKLFKKIIVIVSSLAMMLTLSTPCLLYTSKKDITLLKDNGRDILDI